MKKIKRASHFLKQYFVFSRSERKGIYALLVLIALSLAAPHLWGLAFPPQLLSVSVRGLAPAPQEEPSIAQSHQDNENHSFEPFAFDPNTADSAALARLGFPGRVASGMINYRNKGGVFRKPEDLYRIYHIDSGLVASLIPYVRINQQEPSFRTPVAAHKEEPVMPVVEINTADSAELVGLFGIGPKTASRIIAFRERSGGFFTVEQLTDVFGISEELLVELKGKIEADPSKVTYLDLNTVSYEELRQHPYLRYKTASAIVSYRRQHGPFKKPEELKNIVILPDSVYQKLLPYIRLGE